ncbi:hypothetical protein R3P38DRAFT_3564496 [Favolaschia claudopus]|uniref:Uncharacterized protein n=1 Tax=Favolaschia claudopus TaxID=2862362 RepID=A0AAW0DVF4_9AGAR
MSADELVLQNLVYHEQLIVQISELDHVPPALKQQQNRLKRLKKDAVTLERKVKSLEAQTQRTKTEDEGLIGSTKRRFLANVTGRKDRFEMRCQELQSKLDCYEKTKQELAALDNKIFDGPTPDYPENDQLGAQVQHAQKKHDAIRQHLDNESKAADLLQKTYSSLSTCVDKMRDQHWIQPSFGGPIYTVEQLARTAEICLQRATEVSPNARHIGRVCIPQNVYDAFPSFGPFMGDSSTFRRVLKQASSQPLNSVHIGQEAARLIRNHADTAKADLKTATTELSRARDDLHAFRLSVFEKLPCASPPSEFYIALSETLRSFF